MEDKYKPKNAEEIDHWTVPENLIINKENDTEEKDSIINVK